MTTALLCPESAWALTSQQRNALGHIGQVLGGQKICPRLHLQEAMISGLAVMFDLDLTASEQSSIVTAKAKETIGAWRGKDPILACAAVLMLYGPNGANVPGLLAEK
jgi:hypothetical protein